MLKENEEIELNGLINGSEILEDFSLKFNYPVLTQSIEQSIFFQPSMSLGLVITNSSSNCYTSCALIALKSNIRITNANGDFREESLRTFVTNRAKIKSNDGEFVTKIMIPVSKSTRIVSGFRQIHEGELPGNSIVSIAYHFQLEEDSTIKEAGIAICTSDNQIHFVEEACNFLHRKRFDLFDDYRLLGDIIMTYTDEFPVFDIKNGNDEMKKLLSNLLKLSNEVNRV